MMNKLSVFVLVVIFNTISGTPQIIAPYPDNIFAIEYETAQTTCVATDTDKSKKPDRIVFVTKGSFGEVTVIADEGPSGRVYYKNKTQDNGRKLFVTLHFNNITTKDDSNNANYECRGYTEGEVAKYGFSVSVISRNELPAIQVSESKKVQFGDATVLRCNVTNLNMFAKITKLIWTKDGKVTDVALEPYRIQSLRLCKVYHPDDGGLFTCHWIVKLRGTKDYSITGNVRVTVEPKFFTRRLTDNVIEVLEGHNATMNCSAKGNPLKTEWKMKKDKDNGVKSFGILENAAKYKFSNLDKLEDHSLTIIQADFQDSGNYYCCIGSSNQTDVQGCQVFTLKVKGINTESSASMFRAQYSVVLLLGLVSWFALK